MRVFQVTLTSIVFGKDDPSGWPKDKVLEHLIDNPGMIGSIQSVRMAPQGAVVDEKPVSPTRRVAAQKKNQTPSVAWGQNVTSNGSVVWFGRGGSHRFYEQTSATDQPKSTALEKRPASLSSDTPAMIISARQKMETLGLSLRRAARNVCGLRGTRPCLGPQSSMRRERIDIGANHDQTTTSKVDLPSV